MRIMVAVGEIEDGRFDPRGSQTLDVPDTFKWDTWVKGRVLSKAGREILPWCAGKRPNIPFGEMDFETPYQIGKGPIKIVWWFA